MSPAELTELPLLLLPQRSESMLSQSLSRKVAEAVAAVLSLSGKGAEKVAFARSLSEKAAEEVASVLAAWTLEVFALVEGFQTNVLEIVV